jgi:hypothetical protein
VSVGQLNPAYQCQCQVTVPLMHLGEDTGLCQGCNYIYDENLYEMRLRQHTPNYTYDTLDDFLRVFDPQYAALA